jgi:pimeloyl-ACP methyl ester carboxylesterase
LAERQILAAGFGNAAAKAILRRGVLRASLAAEAAGVMQMPNWNDIYFTSRDGLRLYARHYAVPGSPRRPVLCLAGLSRNSRDFHDLATALAIQDEAGRDVYCVDYRGRGRSQSDPDWKNYSILVELNDVLDFMTMRGLHSTAIVGTSRGGLITMLMGVLRPGAIGAVVLNDIGPVIEREGLARIIAYVGRVPLPATWEDATALVSEMNRRQFPAVTAQQWVEFAHQVFNDDNGLPAPSYDPDLSKATSLLSGDLPELWPQFAALGHAPMLAIRGENSDILSPKTFAEMQVRHPRVDAIVVKGQGHAPLLKDAPTITAVARFLALADAQYRGASMEAGATA